MNLFFFLLRIDIRNCITPSPLQRFKHGLMSTESVSKTEKLTVTGCGTGSIDGVPNDQIYPDHAINKPKFLELIKRRTWTGFGQLIT